RKFCQQEYRYNYGSTESYQLTVEPFVFTKLPIDPFENRPYLLQREKRWGLLATHPISSLNPGQLNCPRTPKFG
ncbi:MAG: hypothetical protein ACOY9Y_00455, partial [Bacillota bacterium]